MGLRVYAAPDSCSEREENCQTHRHTHTQRQSDKKTGRERCPKGTRWTCVQLNSAADPLSLSSFAVNALFQYSNCCPAAASPRKHDACISIPGADGEDSLSLNPSLYSDASSPPLLTKAAFTVMSESISLIPIPFSFSFLMLLALNLV